MLVFLIPTLRVTGTVDKGGNCLTDAIAKELGVTHAKAHTIKVTKGIAAGKQQEKSPPQFRQYLKRW
jgi:cell division ATPase FtsA